MSSFPHTDIAAAARNGLRIFVINLRGSTERRAAMQQQLGDLGLPFEFFDAVDGKKLQAQDLAAYDGRKRRLFFGKDLSQGEIGCLLSHRAIYRKIVAEKIPAALILEDDTILSSALPDVLAALQAAEGQWDMIRFLSREKNDRQARRLRPLDGRHMLARPYGTPGGAYGYIVTRRAAERLNAKMDKNWIPVDILHGQTWRTGLNVFSVIPSPVTYREDQPSTIGDERFSKKIGLKGTERALYPFTRAGLKLYELAGKNMSSLAFYLYDMAKKNAAPNNSKAE